MWNTTSQDFFHCSTVTVTTFHPTIHFFFTLIQHDPYQHKFHWSSEEYSLNLACHSQNRISHVYIVPWPEGKVTSYNSIMGGDCYTVPICALWTVSRIWDMGLWLAGVIPCVSDSSISMFIPKGPVNSGKQQYIVTDVNDRNSHCFAEATEQHIVCC